MSKASSKPIALEDHEPHVFKVYISWLYGDRTELFSLIAASVPQFREIIGGAAAADEDSVAKDIFCGMWMLGDRLRDHALCNRVIDHLITHKKIDGGILSGRTAEFLCEKSAAESGLHR